MEGDGLISRAGNSKSSRSKGKKKSRRSKAADTAAEATEETSRLAEEGAAEESTPDEEPTAEAETAADETSTEETVAEDTKSADAADEPTADEPSEEPPADDAKAETPATPEESSEEDELPKLEGDRLRACLEAVLFASPEPVSRRRLYRLLPEADNAAIREALLELEGELLSTPRGYFLVEESSGFRFLSKSEFAPHVARLRREKRRIRLSTAAFEALAVIAYRQPVRRADLEAIRGVQCGAILKNLLEWSLIRVVGHDESPGRPLLYGTTGDFLEMLGLSDLSDLPEPERLRERGEDRGLQVLDRIIEEGGGEPVVSDEPIEGAEASTEEESCSAATSPESSDEGSVESEEEKPTPEEGAPAGDGEFDLDLDGDDDES